MSRVTQAAARTRGMARHFIWRIFVHNGLLKLLSFIFALGLFLIVRTEQVREYARVAHVHIITASSVIVLGTKDRTVDVIVRMPNTLFSRQPSDAELTGELDLSRERVGKIRIRLSQDNFPELDRRYTLNIPNPWLDVDLDALERKMVSVQAVLQGEPAGGLIVEKVIVTPNKVEVTGAHREVSKLDSILTSTINIDNVNKQTFSDAKLVIDEDSSIRVREEKVNVQVVVGQKRFKRLFRSIPINVSHPYLFRLKPTHIDIELLGQREVLDRIRPGDIRATFDSSDLGTGAQDRKVIVNIPENTSLVRVLPETVEVYIPD